MAATHAVNPLGSDKQWFVCRLVVERVCEAIVVSNFSVTLILMIYGENLAWASVWSAYLHTCMLAASSSYVCWAQTLSSITNTTIKALHL